MNLSSSTLLLYLYECSIPYVLCHRLIPLKNKGERERKRMPKSLLCLPCLNLIWTRTSCRRGRSCTYSLSLFSFFTFLVCDDLCPPDSFDNKQTFESGLCSHLLIIKKIKGNKPSLTSIVLSISLFLHSDKITDLTNQYFLFCFIVPFLNIFYDDDD